MNPHDILGVNPGGAHPRKYDERDFPLHSPEIGGASVPFDWQKGYDVEADLGYQAPTKDQGQSGSCGGQAISQQAQALSLANGGGNTEMSAKAYYSQVFVPGGGSNSLMLANILIKQGLYKESLVPSYENGMAPSEAFMERPQDISQKAHIDALPTANLYAYTFPVINIDVLAGALRDYKNLLLGLSGSNNGTWLSSHPSTAKVGPYWSHFMFGGKAQLDNGKKTIWAKQSWGSVVAPDTNSYQAITEDHFAAGQIWDAMVIVSAPKPSGITHTFSKDLVFGTKNDEVMVLQQVLAQDGVFSVAPTGYYGSITAQAVLKFRAKYGVPSSTDPKGYVVGPRTRAKLNELYG